MKRRIMMIVTWFCIIAAVCAAADFNGNWRLNQSKSDFANGLPDSKPVQKGPKNPNLGIMNIRMTRNEMSITRATNPPDRREVAFLLDGATHTDGAGRSTYQAAWSGQTLTITETLLSGIHRQRQYSISGDGKTLTVVFTLHDNNGKQVLVRIYDRVK